MPTPNLPGVATESTVAWTPPEQFTFNHIPLLRELLPQLHGVPGFYYLQCAVANRRRAEAEGWQEVANTVTYTITGPSGQIDATLYCFGERVHGSDYKSGKRDCLVDKAIFAATGHTNEDPKFQEHSAAEPEELPESEQSIPMPTPSDDGPEPLPQTTNVPPRVTAATLEAQENEDAAESE